MVKAMRFQGEHSPIQPLNIKMLCSGTTFCLQTSLLISAEGSAKYKKQLQKLGRCSSEFQQSLGKIFHSWEAPISHLHLQWQEAANVFFVNYFPCCICSVFLIILTLLLSLPVLSCLFLICAVWWVMEICVHPACCALGVTDGAPGTQRLLA